jgi:hypothetical protein
MRRLAAHVLLLALLLPALPATAAVAPPDDKRAAR